MGFGSRKILKKWKQRSLGYLAVELMENAIVKQIYDEFDEQKIYEILYQMAFLNGKCLLIFFTLSEIKNSILTDFSSSPYRSDWKIYWQRVFQSIS